MYGASDKATQESPYEKAVRLFREFLVRRRFVVKGLYKLRRVAAECYRIKINYNKPDDRADRIDARERDYCPPRFRSYGEGKAVLTMGYVTVSRGTTYQQAFNMVVGQGMRMPNFAEAMAFFYLNPCLDWTDDVPRVAPTGRTLLLDKYETSDSERGPECILSYGEDHLWVGSWKANIETTSDSNHADKFRVIGVCSVSPGFKQHRLCRRRLLIRILEALQWCLHGYDE